MSECTCKEPGKNGLLLIFAGETYYYKQLMAGLEGGNSVSRESP